MQSSLNILTKFVMSRLSYETRLLKLREAYATCSIPTACELAMDMISLSIEDGGIEAKDAIEIHRNALQDNRKGWKAAYWDKGAKEVVQDLWNNRKQQ
jgi:hypothetical protein